MTCSPSPSPALTERHFTVANGSGATLTVCDFGARVVCLEVPDARGILRDVIYGTDGPFAAGERSFGMTAGRYANRIKGSRFTIDGREYILPHNEVHGGIPVQCHGGANGFDRFFWEAETLGCGVRFTRRSPDGEEGFPGNLQVSVTYELTEDNCLRITYLATTDKPTHVNLTNHSYFNLSGHGGYALDHRLKVAASRFILNDECYCPAEILPVEDTPFDFRESRRIDFGLQTDHPQLRRMGGPSVCWILDGDSPAATLEAPDGLLRMEVRTTEPCLLMYPATHFDGSIEGKHYPLEKYGGIALETMHAASSPNDSRFPSTLLRPGEVFHSCTEFRFI